MKKFIALLMAFVMAMSLATMAWGAEPVEVSDEAGVVAAFANGGTYKLTKSVAVAENTRFVVGSGKAVTLDLGGNTLSSTNTETNTHNFFIDVNGGTLTISNGAVEYTHTGTNMGWNGATEVFDVTNGGVLNMTGVTAKISGTDMNFAVHMNNWGSVTFYADNCVFDATYCGVRVFNSGPDKNDVTIKNSTLKGATRAFWVHNYASSDMGGKVYSGASVAYDESEVLARLDLDIYNNGNTFELTGTAKSPIRYGFNEPVYFTEQGVRVTDVAVAEPETNTDNLDTDEKELVEGVSTSFDSAANEALGDAASAVADNNPVSADDVASALADAGITGAVEEFDIVVESSFDVEITEVVADNTDVTSITLNITPVYQMVATNGTDEVVLDEGELEITEPVTITVKIPDTFAVQATGGKIYVTHKNTYVYEATVAGTAGNYTATFTSEHGFSPFVFSLAPTTVAVVGTQEYASLQAAVDAAPAGATVELAKNAGEVTVGKAVTIDPNGFTVTVKAATGYQVMKDTNGNYVVSTGNTSSTNSYDDDDVAIITKAGTKVAIADGAKVVMTQENKQTVNGKFASLIPAYFSYDGVNYVVCHEASATHLVTVKGTKYYTCAFNGFVPKVEKDNGQLYTAPLKATCGKVGTGEAKYVILDNVYYLLSDLGTRYALVDGKMVVYSTSTGTMQEHVYDATKSELKYNKDGTVATFKCAVCNNAISVVAKKPAFATNYTAITLGTEGTYYYVSNTTGTSSSTSTDKTVTSADTFDAGIAMYVGMSIMAAAGGAVVIGKKKD